MDESWLKSRRADPPEAEAQLLAFFGLTPPLDEERVGERVAIKRKYWNRLKSATSPEARDRVATILDNIENYSARLLLGAANTGSHSVDDLPETVYETDLVPEQLLSVVERLLFRGMVDAAQREADAVRRSHGTAWQPPVALSRILLTRIDLGEPIRLSDIDQTIAMLVDVEHRHPRNVPVWTQAADLLYEGAERDVSGPGRAARLERLLVLTGEAPSKLRPVPASIMARSALAKLGLGRIEEALVDAVSAANDAPGDQDLRSTLARALVARGAGPLLPISSVEDLRVFEDIVNTAAWIAHGIADAEVAVRPYRLWAAKASTQLFCGSLGLRSTLGFMTLFIWTLVHNRARSKPAWQILAEGDDLERPDQPDLPGNRLRESADVRLVHELARRPYIGW